MKTFSATLTGSLSAAVIAAVVSAYPATAQTAQPAPDTVESHLAAGKSAAGGRDDTPDFYGLVTAIYIPCVATISVLWRELGWKKGVGIVALTVGAALLFGGIAYRILSLF